MSKEYRTWSLTSEISKIGSKPCRVTVAAGIPPKEYERIEVIEIEAYNDLKEKLENNRFEGMGEDI